MMQMGEAHRRDDHPKRVRVCCASRAKIHDAHNTRWHAAFSILPTENAAAAARQTMVSRGPMAEDIVPLAPTAAGWWPLVHQQRKRERYDFLGSASRNY